MHTPVCVCDNCKIEQYGLVGYLRIVADKQARDWVDTNYEPWLLDMAADRIELLEELTPDCVLMEIPYDVTCARCGKVVSSEDAVAEEGDEWECIPCWERCEAQERQSALETSAEPFYRCGCPKQYIQEEPPIVRTICKEHRDMRGTPIELTGNRGSKP